MDLTVVRAPGPLRGSCSVPGDKSLSHRAVLFAAMAEGTSALTGVLDSLDVRASIEAVRALGAGVVLRKRDGGALDLEVTGWGTAGPVTPGTSIDCGNSGTTCRLLAGILAGWPVDVTLVGDESLSRRPMRRVTEPLSRMGAKFETGPDGTLPLRISGGALTPITYESPVASAQVKTAVLLAGLHTSGTTTVTEPVLSRDHTERLLPAFGVPVATRSVESGDGSGAPARPSASVTGPVVPRACDIEVPGDPSSAAFPLVAAMLIRGSEIVVEHVCVNPTRIGFVDVLRRMGADLTVVPGQGPGSEPTGSIRATAGAVLRPTVVTGVEAPSLIDELPILALAAAQAEGTTRFEGIGELRVKESDRLAAIVDGLTRLGGSVEAGVDWLEVTGPSQLVGTSLSSLGDHRLAMTWAVAGLIASGETVVRDFQAVDVSYPGFLETFARLSVR